MEEDKVNPNSQSPSPLPGWLEDEALSGQWLGAGGGSGLPLSDTEEEGAFAYMHEEWEYDTDQELFQWGDVTGQELCLCEEATGREFYQRHEEVTVEEVCPCGVVRRREWHQWEVGVRVQWGDGTQQELYHREESETVEELYPWDEEDETHQELSQWEEDQTFQELSQWEEDLTYQELSQWEEDLTFQELSPCEEDLSFQELSPCEGDLTYQELSQWEEDLTCQELSQWEGEGYRLLSPLEEDVRGHPHTYQWEGDMREAELSPVGDNRDKEVCQGKDYSLQKLAQWEKDKSDQKLSQRKESVSSQGLSQWAEGITYRSWDKPFLPENAQTCAQQGPGSPTKVGTQVAGEAARDLPSASPAPGSRTGDEPAAAAAAAAAGAAEEVEEPPQPLAPEVEKAPGSPAGREEVPSAGTESPVPAPPSPPGRRRSLWDFVWAITCDIVHRAWLVIQASGQQPEEQRDLEQSTAAELEAAAPGQREESPISAPQSPCCPPSPSPGPLGAQVLSEQQEEADRGSVLAEEESKEGAWAGELEHSLCKDEEHTEPSQGEINKYQEEFQGEASTEPEFSQEEASSYQEGSQGEACIEQELSLEEAGSYHELSNWDECIEEELSHSNVGSYQEVLEWEECMEQGLSQGQVSNSQKLSDWEEYSEHELSHRDVGSYQEASDWEESMGQDLSEQEDSNGQEGSRGNGKRPSVQSSWENDSEQDLAQDSREQSIGDKPLLREEDKWDGVSVLELPEEEDRERRLAALAGGGLPVPVPREAWVEHGPSELRASPPHLEAPASMGHTASPDFEEQVPEAGTQSPGPARRYRPRFSVFQQRALTPSQQLGRPQRRTSILRRALRSLFCCPCLAPQPED